MKRNYPALCAALLLCLAQGQAAADGHPALTDADIAYSAERYEEAATLYRRDAELGVIAAQVNLAILYTEGQGVPQDYAQAALWFRRAAEQGNKEAQYNLGLLYKEGKGVAKDEAEADKWLRKSEGREGSAPR
jgi:TPR repeat protein